MKTPSPKAAKPTGKGGETHSYYFLKRLGFFKLISCYPWRGGGRGHTHVTGWHSQRDGQTDRQDSILGARSCLPACFSR